MRRLESRWGRLKERFLRYALRYSYIGHYSNLFGNPHQSKTYRAAKSISFFFKNAKNSSLKLRVWWCSAWFSMYRRVLSISPTPMLNAPYPFCQANELCFGKVSWIHLDEPPLINCSPLEVGIVFGSDNSKCTWSGIPPTANNFMLFFLVIPPRYGKSLSCNSGVIIGRRSWVLKSQWKRALEYEWDIWEFSRPLCGLDFMLFQLPSHKWSGLLSFGSYGTIMGLENINKRRAGLKEKLKSIAND